MTLTSKLLITGTGALTVTGGIVGTIYLSNGGTEISKFLKENDYVLLTISDSDNVQWGKRWKEYVQSANDKWKLENYQSSSQNIDNAPENFKRACINLSKTKISDTKDSNYQEVLKYCTKEFAISTLLEGEGLKVIADSNKQDAKWKVVWGKYFDSAKDMNPLKLADLRNPIRDTVPNDYKDKCDEGKVKEVKNKKDQNYLTIKSWCSTNKD